jgi:hypothetical protein
MKPRTISTLHTRHTGFAATDAAFPYCLTPMPTDQLQEKTRRFFAGFMIHAETARVTGDCRVQ